MKKLMVFSIWIAAFTIPVILFGQNNKPVTDYLNIPGPIMFENKAFNLSWSSHPASDFYKQEYIAKGDIPDKYTTMILVDVLKGQTNIKDVVAAKVAELKKLKAGNPIVNYETMNNPATGEYMIDFLLTANTPDGKNISIVERNVYRYKVCTDKSGQKNILLFGVSTRGYDAGINQFFASLKSNRKDLINSVSQFKTPEVSIK